MNDVKEIIFTGDAVKNIVSQAIKEGFVEFQQEKKKRWLPNAAGRYLARKNFEHLLANTIPKKRRDCSTDQRYKKYKTIARYFDGARVFDSKVKTELLLRVVVKRVIGKSGKKRMVNSSDYERNRGKYNILLKNRLKVLNKYFVSGGYRVQFGSDYCRVIYIKKSVQL